MLKNALSALIDKIQATFPPNRIVAILTPIIGVPVAGYLSVQAAKWIPGHPHYDPAVILGLFAAGALSALALANKWLDGWQQHEANVANVDLALAYEPPPPAEPPPVTW